MKKLFLASLVVLVASAISTYLLYLDDSFLETENDFGSKIVLGFAQLGAESEWRSASSASIKDAARRYGIELMFENAQQKQENQIKAIRSFIAHRVDVIAFSPIVETGWDNILLEAKAEGIPVVLVDRHIRTESDGLFAAFVGSDFVEEGRKAGRWLRKKFADAEGEVRVVELRGTEGSSPMRGRYEGFREALGDNDWDNDPKSSAQFKVLCSLRGDFMRSKGRETMEQILSSYSNIDVLFAHNDDMAMGAVEAMEERGIRPGKDVVVISVDAQRSAVEAMKQGKINCIVECNPYVGDRLMELVRKLVAGVSVPSRIYSEEKVYTEDDAPEDLPVHPY
ncbi:MAG: ABC transporter substrate-binding protein [Synergistaceae bacterium]|jgi:simple sugar transport system substrate-binding protein|nr:ABC transporter substrate-binding protein [Synergistaceae bacterium]